jgi:hypothetical protein
MMAPGRRVTFEGLADYQGHDPRAHFKANHGRILARTAAASKHVGRQGRRSAAHTP